MDVKMFKLSKQVVSKIEKSYYSGEYPSEAVITATGILDQVNPNNSEHTVYADDTDIKLVLSIVPEIMEYEVPYKTGDCTATIRESEYAALMFALMKANAPESIIYDLTHSMMHHKTFIYGEYTITLTHWFCRWFLCNIESVWEEYIPENDDIIRNLRIVCMRGFDL